MTAADSGERTTTRRRLNDNDDTFSTPPMKAHMDGMQCALLQSVSSPFSSSIEHFVGQRVSVFGLIQGDIHLCASCVDAQVPRNAT